LYDAILGSEPIDNDIDATFKAIGCDKAGAPRNPPFRAGPSICRQSLDEKRLGPGTQLLLARRGAFEKGCERRDARQTVGSADLFEPGLVLRVLEGCAATMAETLKTTEIKRQQKIGQTARSIG
jgi:hypothetical protein